MSWKRSVLIWALSPLSTLTGSSPTLLKNLPAKVGSWSICACCSALYFELMSWQKAEGLSVPSWGCTWTFQAQKSTF